jgi:hypothetical protein
LLVVEFVAVVDGLVDVDGIVSTCPTLIALGLVILFADSKLDRETLYFLAIADRVSPDLTV